MRLPRQPEETLFENLSRSAGVTQRTPHSTFRMGGPPAQQHFKLPIYQLPTYPIPLRLIPNPCRDITKKSSRSSQNSLRSSPQGLRLAPQGVRSAHVGTLSQGEIQCFQCLRPIHRPCDVESQIFFLGS